MEGYFSFLWPINYFTYGTVQLKLHTRVIPHACFSVDREIIMRACTYKFTRVIPTQAILTRVPYIS